MVPQEVKVNGKTVNFSYDGMSLSLLVDLSDTNCSAVKTVEITYPDNNQCVANGEIGQMRRVRNNVYQLKTRNAGIVLTDDLANMECAGRTITYDPKCFTEIINFFRDRFAHLDSVLKEQKLNEDDYKFFVDYTY